MNKKEEFESLKKMAEKKMAADSFKLAKMHKNGFNQIVTIRVYDDNWRTAKGYQLTEVEIRKDFEWAWQWAKEAEV